MGLDLSNFATKTDLNKEKKVDTSSFAKKPDSASLKSDVDKLEIYKLEIMPTNLTNLKRKVDKLDVHKLVPIPVALSKLSDVVKNDIIKKNVYNAKIENIEDKIPDITKLATKTTATAKINEIKGEITNINNLATTTAFTAVKNKVPNVSNLVKKLTKTQKLMTLKKILTMLR